MSRRMLIMALLAAPLALTAQDAPRPGRSPSYQQRFAEVTRMAPVLAQSAAVDGRVLQRDAGRLIFTSGRMWLLTQVGGRTVGAVFRGEGSFRFEPPSAVERAELRRRLDAPALDIPIGGAVLLFTDSTADFLRGLRFEAAPAPVGLGDVVRDFTESLKGMHDGTFDADVMGALINETETGFFAARLERPRGDQLLYVVNPALSEGIRLYRSVGRRQWRAAWAVVSQFAPPHLPVSVGWSHRSRLRIPHYRVDTRMAEALSANLRMHTAVTMTVVADAPVGPWLRFGLDERLVIDSARWSGGEAPETYKADDDDDLWVLAPRPLRTGDSLALTLYYQGTVVDRFGEWFYIATGADWYPRNNQGADLATFDLTFRSNPRWALVSVGERTESTTVAGAMVTRWVTRAPTTAATFNLGLFDVLSARYPETPPFDVLLNEQAHDLLRLPQQRNMAQSVAADVANSLRLFGRRFGETPEPRYYITEIPANHGVSYPGVMHLSWGTFQFTNTNGFHELFRAHEVAHQYWGNAVRPATYRDFWLAEGLAEYSGLMYLQAVRGRTNEVYDYLDRYRANLKVVRNDVGAISLGYRNRSPESPNGYVITVYEKGAWVLHMLRVMMMDLSTLRSDRFDGLLQAYYARFRGGAASTDDFRRIAEEQLGTSLDWFFDQWVHGTALPTYRVAWTSEPADEGRFRVKLRVRQEGVPPEFTMPVLVAADLGGGRVARFRVRVNGAQTEYLSPPLPGRPRDLTFNEFRSTLADVNMERW